MTTIKNFSGNYRFLSNFWPCNLYWENAWWPCVENAYQAAKLENPTHRAPFYSCPPGVAKRLGKGSPLRPGWEGVKLDTMRELLSLKFVKGSPLALALLSTGDAVLIEGNTWGDKFWGVCGGVGENNLGLLLMGRRSDLARSL